jgi:uncharacterized membrane protein YfcA
LASTTSSAAPSSAFPPFFFASLAGALAGAGVGFVYSFLTSAIYQINILEIINILLLIVTSLSNSLHFYQNCPNNVSSKQFQKS